jgi:hypothetical protein
MMWKTAKRSQLMVRVAVSIAALFLASWLSTMAYGSTNSAAPKSFSTIDGITYVFTTAIPVGEWPRGIAYNPSNGYIYVGDWLSGTVTVISTSVKPSSTSSSTTSSSARTSAPSSSAQPSYTMEYVAVAVVAVIVILVVALLIRGRK